MSVTQLAIREILYRKTGFLFAGLLIALAVGLVVETIGRLNAYAAQTQTLLMSRQMALEKRITEINSDIRQAMENLGYNIVMLPEGQDLGDWYAEDYAAKTMPDTCVDLLVRFRPDTVEQLTPSLCRKIWWEERNTTVLLVGLGGTVGAKQPGEWRAEQQPVAPGTVHLGYELHQAFGLSRGCVMKLRNRSYTVEQCLLERGTKDDITIWFNLENLQVLLDEPGRINEIRALEKPAAWSNVKHVRNEMAQLLPGVQVVEITDLASAKTQARSKTIEEGEASIQREQANRKALLASQTRLAWLLVPLVLLLSTAWLGLLAFRNVSERRVEIGTLLSLGYRPTQVVRLLATRSLLLCLVGGCLGLACSAVRGTLSRDLVTLATIVALASTLVATWWPTFYATRQDPSAILRGD